MENHTKIVHLFFSLCDAPLSREFPCKLHRATSIPSSYDTLEAVRVLVVVQGIHDNADVFSNCILSDIFIEGLLNDYPSYIVFSRPVITQQLYCLMAPVLFEMTKLFSWKDPG